jgi:glycosyltransferase involved in cell wall biosynthesis
VTSTDVQPSQREAGVASVGLGFAWGADRRAVRRVRNAAPSSRIALLIHDLRGGGAERVVLKLAKQMVQSGRQVDLVLVRARGEYVDQIPPGVRLVDLDKSNVFKAVPALVRYLRQERPRALLSNLTHVNVAALIARQVAGVRTRVVVTEHNQISRKAAAPVGLRGRLVYRAVPWLYALADDVVAVSRGAAADIARFARLDAERVTCIYNPVYDEALIEASTRPVDHPWLRPDEPPVVLAAGRLHPQKGFDILLRAFAVVRTATPCRLIIMGEGDERTRLEDLAQALGVNDDVSLVGFVQNPYAMMSRAATFVVSSRWEGFSVVLLEALACGVPVVSTNCASGPSEILDGGRYGALVPVEDEAALADGILRALGERRPDGVDRAKAFNVETAAQAYLKLLERA